MVVTSETFIDIKSNTTAKQLIGFLQKVPESATIDLDCDERDRLSRVVVSWTEIRS